MDLTFGLEILCCSLFKRWGVDFNINGRIFETGS